MATVKITYRGKEYDVNAGMTVRDAIKKIGLEPEAVLAVSDGRLITDDTIITADMRIKLVAVVSGGSLTADPSSRGRGGSLPGLAVRRPRPAGEGWGEGQA